LGADEALFWKVDFLSLLLNRLLFQPVMRRRGSHSDGSTNDGGFIMQAPSVCAALLKNGFHNIGAICNDKLHGVAICLPW
jgi:predicted RNA binding protein YcfA (HicA-like mRNA interferase family)